MKKFVSVFAIVCMATGMAVAATPAPSHLKRDADGGYTVTYDYKDKAKTGWYIAARADMNFMNWKNKYSTDLPDADDDFKDDKYSFESFFGGSIAGGYHFNDFWRAELEGGYLGKFTDADNGFNFELSVPYVMANGYYDFLNGLYVGAGLGVAMPTTHLDSEYFVSGNREKTSVSPMAGVMLGYATKLDDNLVLDFRYRLSGFGGTDQSRNFMYDEDTVYYAKNKIGLILDNSISIGLRYEF